MKFRKGVHAFSKTIDHFVWIVRYWRKVFVQGTKEYMERKFFSREHPEKEDKRRI